MLQKLKKLASSQRPTNKMYNELVERINLLSNIGAHGGGLSLSKSVHGIHIKGNNVSQIRKAFVKTAAGVGVKIDCYLGVDETGTEIEVTCEITGVGVHLNSAIPRLADGDMIFVINEDGTWRSIMTFQSSQDCT